MNLYELIDNLIALTCEEMPEEAKKSLDDAIDHLVSGLSDKELDNSVDSKGGMSEEYEEILVKSFLNQSLAFA